MKEEKYYHDYCAGCGLCCEVAEGASMKMEEDGFYYPDKFSKDVLEVCRRVCPVNGRELEDMSRSEIWGGYKGKYLGWSTDKDIRYMASSGGVLLSSMGNPKPLPVYWDRILLNASQVTNPPIDPLREPMETRVSLGKK